MVQTQGVAQFVSDVQRAIWASGERRLDDQDVARQDGAALDVGAHRAIALGDLVDKKGVDDRRRIGRLEVQTQQIIEAVDAGQGRTDERGARRQPDDADRLAAEVGAAVGGVQRRRADAAGLAEARSGDQCHGQGCL